MKKVVAIHISVPEIQGLLLKEYGVIWSVSAIFRELEIIKAVAVPLLPFDSPQRNRLVERVRGELRKEGDRVINVPRSALFEFFIEERKMLAADFVIVTER